MPEPEDERLRDEGRLRAATGPAGIRGNPQFGWTCPASTPRTGLVRAMGNGPVQEEVVVRYLARAFVRPPHVDGTAQWFADFARAVGDPTLVPRAVVELAGGGAVQRVALGSLSGNWLVQTTAESVDVQSSPQVGQQSIEFADFCAKAAIQLRAAVEFLGSNAWRIAVVREWIFRELTNDELTACRTRLINLPDLSVGAVPFEWDWRMAKNVERTVGQTTLNTNTIATVKQLTVTFPGTEERTRLWLSTDVNTTPKETRSRFEGSDVAGFLQQSAPWHSEIEQSLLRFMALT